MKKRMLSQDIVKGLAILVVCQLHALQVTKFIFYPLVALFGFIMPVFIFLSGYNYHQKQLPPAVMIRNRVGRILKIYLIWCFAMFVIMGSYFYLHGSGTPLEILRSFGAHLLSESGCKMLGIIVPTAMFQHVLGPCWFIQYLISASVVFFLFVDYALRSFKHLFSTVSALILTTFLFLQFRIYLPWGFHCAPALAALMIIAARLAKDNQFFAPTSRPVWTVVNTLISLIIVDAIQFRFPSGGILGAGLLGEYYGSIEVCFLVCFGVFGTYFLINLGKLIEKIPYISTGLIWLGRHSLEILLLHRPIAYLIREAMGLPHFISGNPLFIEKITPENLIAFLLIFVFMIPMLIAFDKYKARKKADAV